MGATRTIALIPWYQFLNSLLFWQAVWFLYFQSNLSGAEAIILYSVYDISVTVLELPSGYFSDRIGRRFTLLLSTLCSLPVLDLSRFSAAPSARLSHFPFKSDWAFPAQC